MVNKDEFRSSLLSMSKTMLHRKLHLVGGAPASSENAIKISQFFEAWLFLASDVVSQSGLSDISIMQRLKNFCLGLQHGDIVEILNICTDAAALLMEDTVTDYMTFKESIASQHQNHDLIVRLLSPIMPLVVSLFEAPDVKAETLKLVLPFLRFGRRLNLKAIGLEEQAITAYLDCETKLAAVDLDKVPDLISGCNAIMRCWLRDLDLKNLVPQHGTGSVAEGRLSLYDKFLCLGIDTYLKVVLGPLWHEYYPVPPRENIVRVSRTIFVPKTFSKLRTISMEPATLQYFQQGVMKKLYRHIAEHPYLSRRIKLSDQSQNRELAREGSIDGSFATIDLSAASDSVSWKLVKSVFAKTPLLKWLYATRSKQTELPGGRVLSLKKFAPMGSALCFPVECLIFSVVVEYVSQRWCSQTGVTKSRYSVYGDDMVVDTRIVPDLVEALEALGFTVNHDKSFVTGKFRESCGGDYYEGIDVSSVYYGIDTYNARKLSPEVYASLCSFCNHCEERGLHELKTYLVRLLLPSHPYFTDTSQRSPALYSKCPTNFHVRQKWHEDFQCWMGRFMTVLSKPCPRQVCDGICEDDIAYFVRLASMALSSHVRSYDQEVADINLHGSRIRLGYVAREVVPLINRVQHIAP